MSETRERIVGAAAELFRRQGYTGTGVKQVVSLAQAPFGSLYHFFPGGKEQLGEEVVRRAGVYYGDLVIGALDGTSDLPTAIRDAFAGAAVVLEQSGYADACPIATLAMEVADSDGPLRRATAEVFASWLDRSTAVFTAAGVAPPRDRELGVELVAALEGAFVVCRATRTTEGLHVAGALVAESARTALTVPGGADRPGRR